MPDATINNPTTNTKAPVPSPEGDLTIPLSIRNRKIVVFEDTVKGMSSLNARGKFDILPHHGNFISLIKEYITIYKLDGTKQTIPIENGVIYVKKSEIYCYIDLLSAPAAATPPQQAVVNKE